MSSDLQGKVAIVTGGGRDIGRAAALKLAKCGAAVAINYNASAESAQRTAELIKNANGQATAIQADITSEREITRMVEKTTQAFGDKIHVLVNNAGGLVARKTLDQVDTEYLDTVLKLNLTSLILVSKAVVPYMTEGGSIVNLSSLAARNGGGGGAWTYAAAKGGVLTFTRGIAKELAGKNIRVNCVSPGLIGTTFHDTFTPDDVRQKIAASTPISREGTSDEVADAIVFLASEESSYITGESLEINGGAYFI